MLRYCLKSMFYQYDQHFDTVVQLIIKRGFKYSDAVNNLKEKMLIVLVKHPCINYWIEKGTGRM